MAERRDHAPGVIDLGRVDLGRDDADLGAAVGQHLAPGVDDQGMTEGLASLGMLAALGGGADVTAVLDRPGAQKDVPVGLAGDAGEGRGHRQEPGPRLGEDAVKGGETQIVANRHAEHPPRGRGDDGASTRLEDRRFAVGFAARQIDVEHMDLVVPGDDGAARIEEIGPVGDLPGGELHR